MNYKLSKSTYVKGCQCEKALWLNKHKPELKDKITDKQQHIFDNGHAVGYLAQKLFPNGIDLEQNYNHRDYETSLQKMTELLKLENVSIYEAPFLYNEVLSIMDVLNIKDGKAIAYEVKSSTSVTDCYLKDCALQYYVMTHSGLQLEDFNIVYVNNQYVKNGELDLNEFFIIESVLERILELQPDVEANIEKFKSVLELAEVPEIGIGPQCEDPYTCPFKSHCWKNVPEYSVFNIAFLKADKKFQLYNNGIVDIVDVPDDYKLSARQRLQVDTEKFQTSIIQETAITNFLNSVTYPLYFVDFESIMPTIPIWDQSKPYQQIAFQYSLHVQQEPNGPIEHFEFLAENDLNVDPRIGFFVQLYNDLECGNFERHHGDVIVYNAAFERTVLLKIAEDFPYLAEYVAKIIPRFKDLMSVFQNQYYLTPEMKGRYSIKNVLPALCPELSYNDLEITKGDQVTSIFENLYNETDEEKVEHQRKALLEYCKMDTLAMVKIFQHLTERFS